MSDEKTDSRRLAVHRALRIGIMLVMVVAAFTLGYLRFGGIATGLAWPAVVLAYAGVNHAWFIIPVILITWSVWIGRQTKREGWLRFFCSLCGVLFCFAIGGYLVVSKLPSPVPTTDRFAENAAVSQAYRAAYDEGYRYGMVGVMRSYSFYEQPETIGFYEGARRGFQVWCRVRGKAMTYRESRLFRSSAAIDGVDLPPE